MGPTSQWNLASYLDRNLGLILTSRHMDHVKTFILRTLHLLLVSCHSWTKLLPLPILKYVPLEGHLFRNMHFVQQDLVWANEYWFKDEAVPTFQVLCDNSSFPGLYLTPLQTGHTEFTVILNVKCITLAENNKDTATEQCFPTRSQNLRWAKVGRVFLPSIYSSIYWNKHGLSTSTVIKMVLGT